MTIDPYKVKLENVFEGPMDLLVYLIQKNEVNIYNIPISLITDQFLEFFSSHTSFSHIKSLSRSAMTSSFVNFFPSYFHA